MLSFYLQKGTKAVGLAALALSGANLQLVLFWLLHCEHPLLTYNAFTNRAQVITLTNMQIVPL